MTVVLGRQDRPEMVRKARSTMPGVREGATWDQRRLRHRLQSTMQDYPTWQPVPDAPRSRPAVPLAVPNRSTRPGVVGLYANRMIRHGSLPDRTRHVSSGERTLVGGMIGPAQVRRPLAIIGAPSLLGRGSQDHYRALHPAPRPSYGRLRSGVTSNVSRTSISRWVSKRGGAEAIRSLGASFLDVVQSVFVPSVYGTVNARVNASRRILVGTVAAVIVLAGATGTGFAGQQRYEAHDGETVESVASSFGVDPEAIRTSSYLPNGDTLASGQVIVIPEPGQNPLDAAMMAAEREGTSPFVEAAWWVESGDTLAGIGAAHGVSPDVIAQFNGIIDPANLTVGSRVLIPFVAGESIAANGGDAERGGPSVAVPGVGTHAQEHNLSCEYAAAYIATSAFGNGIPESTFLAHVPIASNPHYGYRGNIDGWWGNTTDYGVYPEALVPVLSSWGYVGEVMYTAGDVGPLIAHIDAGHPVMVWLGMWGNTREVLTDQDTYSVFAGMHVVTVYGYDESGIYVSDPAQGTHEFYSWEAFVGMWSVIDGMSLAIYPR